LLHFFHSGERLQRPEEHKTGGSGDSIAAQNVHEPVDPIIQVNVSGADGKLLSKGSDRWARKKVAGGITDPVIGFRLDDSPPAGAMNESHPDEVPRAEDRIPFEELWKEDFALFECFRNVSFYGHSVFSSSANLAWISGRVPRVR
jgi:hypothetical protein